jgi:hypothetical protein
MKITIPKPCHENWAAMTPDEKGRFCQVCSKSVRDFTSASDLQIMNDLSRDSNICGNFRVDQLDRNLSHSFLNSLFAKFAVGFVLTSGGIVSAQTQPKVNSPTKTDVPIKIRSEVAQVQPPKTQPVQTDPLKPMILGKMLATGNISNAPIYIVDGKIINENSFHKINPETIEKMKVLKGKDATSKYGAKAKSGAVIITLKKKLKK